jgi:hypothetical protein
MANFGPILIEILTLALWIFLLLHISTLLDQLGQSMFPGITYRVLIAPGVIAHELSHALLCLLTGAKIHAISFFKREGGSVTHNEPKLWFGQALISWAPLPCLLILIYLILLGLPGFSDVFGNFETWSGLGGMLSAQWASLTSLLGCFASIGEWEFWHYFLAYCVASCVVCMSPSKQDLMNSRRSLFILLLLFVVLEMLLLAITDDSIFLSVIRPISPLITFSLSLLLLLALVMWPFSLLIKLFFGK